MPVRVCWYGDTHSGACRFATHHDDRYPIGVGGTGNHAEVCVLRQGLDGGPVVAQKDVGHVRLRVPVIHRYLGPRQVHLSHAFGHRRRQYYAFPKLIAELLPGRRLVPVEIYYQHRIFVVFSKVPRGVVLAVVVQVHVVPGVINTGVVRGLLQLRRGLARHAGCLRFRAVNGAVIVRIVRTDSHVPPGGIRIPIAGGDGPLGDVILGVRPDVAPDQAADPGITHHMARGIAGSNAAVAALIPSDQPADPGPSRHGPGGIAGGDAASVRSDQAAGIVVAHYHTGRRVTRSDGATAYSDQPAGVGIRHHLAGGIAVGDGAAARSGQPADRSAFTLHIPGEIAGGDAAAVVRSGQPADYIVHSHYPTGDIAGGDAAAAADRSNQPAHNEPSARYIDINHPDVAQDTGRGELAE